MLQFAAQAIQRRWKKMRSTPCPGAKQLLIAADGGGRQQRQPIAAL